tara:strand:- start:964 stop:1587 length:624 start_codon:yes stop_codon:yes gene_type:complete
LSFFNEIAIWINFRISVVFILGLPFVLLIWSIKEKNKVIQKLLFNYWRISILFFISLILFVGNVDFSLLVLNISIILMTICIWFWSDINIELNEYKITHSLTFTTKIWRWAITFIAITFIAQGINNLPCMTSINLAECTPWIEPSKNLYTIINKSFRFLFGANFSEPVAKFLGLFALFIYSLGLFQWIIIKLPKTGRNSDFSNYGDN